MAKYQYRWSGFTDWQSQSGNAIIAIQNKAGSGKKLSINTIEVMQYTVGNSTGGYNLNLMRGTSSDNGIPISVSSFDTSNTLPSSIKIQTHCGFLGTGTPIIVKRQLSQCIPSTAGTALTSNWGTGKIKNYDRNSLSGTISRDTSLEDIVIRPGESIGILQTMQSSSIPLQINFMIIHNNHTYTGQVISNNLATGRNNATLDQYTVSPFVISNTSISDIIYLKNIEVSNTGTTDTPYIQIVPVSSINSQSQSDTTVREQVSKMDTSYPNIDSNQINIIKNAPCLPYGVPAQYITDSSTGSPKGFNYLHTKDFNGPTYFNYFPEHNRYNTAGNNDSSLLSLSQKSQSLLSKGSPIIIREGEAIGIVSGAETAVTAGVVGTSGWMNLFFAMTFSVENAYTPYLTLTGLQTGTDVVILNAGTNTVLFSSYNISGSSIAWQYDYDIITAVDINIVHENYKIIRYENLAINYNGLTLPISQVSDRNYQQ